MPQKNQPLTPDLILPSRSQIEALRAGFESVVPRAALALQSWRSVERGVCGVRTISVEALKAATRVDVTSETERWFWAAVEQFRRVKGPRGGHRHKFTSQRKYSFLLRAMIVILA